MATSLNTFRAFDPSSITVKSYSTACEACYSRKVKCEPIEDSATCKQCSGHSVECKARTRKRKARSGDEVHQRKGSASGDLESLNSSHRRPEASDTSSNASTRRVSSMSSTRQVPFLKKSDSVSVPELFISRDSGTALTLDGDGLRSTELSSQDKFRNKSFISRSAILGDDFQDIDHEDIVEVEAQEAKASSKELEVLRLYGALDLPDLPLRQSLVEAYLERCYTWMPVIDLQTLTGPLQSGEHSLLLLQAVILVGSIMRPDVCDKHFIDCQYQRVKVLIQSGREENPLNILAACCLIQWYTPTAPRDISTDVPRVWNTYAVGLAQQLGMQQESSNPVDNPGLRKRIWASMRVRDNLTASAHGRPRIIQPEDCKASMAMIHDFEDESDSRANTFTHYVGITQILGDLCQIITRNGKIGHEDRQRIAIRLQGFLGMLPEALRLYTPSGLAHQYNVEVAQLHIPILMSVAILFRPKTVFQLTAANAASAAAAFLAFRIFQAIELREQTRFLGSPFAWHLLVTAIPLLSCTKVAALQDEANEALDVLESVFKTLARVRPAAAQNLRSVKAIRRVMTSKSPRLERAAGGSIPFSTEDDDSLRLGHQILQAYGSDATLQLKHIAEVLEAHCNSQADRTAAHTLSSLSGIPHEMCNLYQTKSYVCHQLACRTIFETHSRQSSRMRFLAAPG